MIDSNSSDTYFTQAWYYRMVAKHSGGYNSAAADIKKLYVASKDTSFQLKVIAKTEQ